MVPVFCTASIPFDDAFLGFSVALLISTINLRGARSRSPSACTRLLPQRRPLLPRRTRRTAKAINARNSEPPGLLLTALRLEATLILLLAYVTEVTRFAGAVIYSLPQLFEV